MTSLPANTTRNYLPTLDGWRAVAIASVMVSHAQATFAALRWPGSAWVRAFSYGRLGVDLFFALSGFLICNRLLVEWETHGRISLHDFYLRRIFRILPLYFGYLAALTLLWVAWGVPCSWDAIKSCLLFYRNYATPAEGVYTNHFWSLSVEEHFYLLWPCFLVLAGPRRALWITPLMALLVEVWRRILIHFASFAALLPSQNLLWHTDSRLDALLWGCFAALVCSRTVFRLPGWLPALILLLIAAASAFAWPLLWLDYALLFPLLLVSTVSNPASLLGRLLELPALRWLGRLSYSLYIWQTLFLQRAASPDPGWLAWLKQPGINVLAIFAVAVFSHYCIERPLIRLGRRFVRPGQPPTYLEAAAA